jgi:hypothetical protein
MRAPTIVIALASSSFLYGLSYLVLGVAVGMRYYFWTIAGAAVAAVLVLGEKNFGRTPSAGAATVIPAVIVALPTTLAILARLLS